MPFDTPKEFTVKWGKYARTLEYEDAEGSFIFTFDLGSQYDSKDSSRPGGRSLCLEHHGSRTKRDSRYSRAFERAKQFLESFGYDVEIYGA